MTVVWLVDNTMVRDDCLATIMSFQPATELLRVSDHILAMLLMIWLHMRCVVSLRNATARVDDQLLALLVRGPGSAHAVTFMASD